MTEEEARRRWCPFARQAVWDEGGATGGNRNSANDPNAESNCIGSACMAWRWSGNGFPLPDDPPSIRNRYDGHCGLAGKT